MDVIRRNTDNALRLAVRLAMLVDAGPVSSKRLAEEEGVPSQLTAKLLQQLSAAGLVHSSRGRNGGFTLSRDPGEILLVDVIDAIQGRIRLNRCIGTDNVCPRQASCSICRRLQGLQASIDEALAATTLVDLANEPKLGRGDSDAFEAPTLE